MTHERLSPGFYDDLDDPSRERWWDGEQWTDRRRRKRPRRALVRFGIGALWVLVINLPHLFAAAFELDLCYSCAFRAWGWSVALWIPPILLLFPAARALGGRWWLVATCLSTLPTYTVVVGGVWAFGPVDRLSAWITAGYLVLATIAVLSLLGAVFYEPLSRWVEHRRVT